MLIFELEQFSIGHHRISCAKENIKIVNFDNDYSSSMNWFDLLQYRSSHY